MDYNSLIRTAYFQLLNGNVVLNAVPVPVYDAEALNTSVYPYIILSTQTNTSSYSKNNLGSVHTIVVDIITGFTGAVKSSDRDSIAEQIYSIVRPSRYGISISSFNTSQAQILSSRLVSDTTMDMQNDVYKILRRILTFSHIIKQKTF